VRTIGILAAVGALATFAAQAAVAGEPVPSAEELLAAAIAHHDPGGVWSSGAFVLDLEESRPDGGKRITRIVIDNGQGRFEWWSRERETTREGTLGPEGCRLALNGSSSFTEQAAAEHRLTCDRLQWVRDYYTFLWGLPMKLRDAGTRLGAVERTELDGKPVLGLRVTYDEAVGSDVWYHYFDPETAALAGYRFYHDESAGDGEYIFLAGETAGAGLVLPRARAWYTHRGDRHLGTDTLVELGTP